MSSLLPRSSCKIRPQDKVTTVNQSQVPPRWVLDYLSLAKHAFDDCNLEGPILPYTSRYHVHVQGLHNNHQDFQAKFYRELGTCASLQQFVITPNDLRFARDKFLQISKLYDRGHNCNVCSQNDGVIMKYLSADFNVNIFVLITQADKQEEGFIIKTIFR